MQDLVGNCRYCGAEVYCLDGFLNGVVDEDQLLSCYDCAEEE
ncbi:hypothetical protein [Halobacillus salinarum]|nr:hypothetical protein [Halobacillus salinarum]